MFRGTGSGHPSGHGAGQLQSRDPRATSAYQRSSALEQHPEVERVIGMARRPFDPAAHGWTKAEYRQGDILDRDAVDALVADADIVVHLAFIIMGSREESARVNLAGTRNVFEATVAAAARAGGWCTPRRSRPTAITPTTPCRSPRRCRPRGSPEHYYSEQKAACEAALAEITAGTTARGLHPAAVHRRRAEGTRARRGDAVEPTSRCGPQSVTKACLCSSRRSPIRARRCNSFTTTTSPPRSPWPQRLPRRRAPTTSPATGVLSMSDVGHALGARPVPVPRVAVTATSEVLARLPFVPSALEWLHAGRTSVVMDTGKAKIPAGLDTEIHRRRDIVGAGGVDLDYCV